MLKYSDKNNSQQCLFINNGFVLFTNKSKIINMEDLWINDIQLAWRVVQSLKFNNMMHNYYTMKNNSQQNHKYLHNFQFWWYKCVLANCGT